MHAKASADIELSSGAERSIVLELKRILKSQAERKSHYLLGIFVENEGDADDFEAPVDLVEIETRVERILSDLKN